MKHKLPRASFSFGGVFTKSWSGAQRFCLWSFLLFGAFFLLPACQKASRVPKEKRVSKKVPEKHKNKSRKTPLRQENPRIPKKRITKIRPKKRFNTNPRRVKKPFVSIGYKANLIPKGMAKEDTHIEIMDLALQGDYAYACTMIFGLQIYNIKNPKAPKQAGEFNFSPPYGHFRHPGCQHVSVDGHYAYISSHVTSFQPKPFVAVVDIKNPRKPKIVDYYSDKFMNPQGLVARGGWVYVAALQKGLHIFRMEGKRLRLQAKLGGFQNAWGVSLWKDIALLADGSGGVQMIDIRNPKRPIRLAKIATTGFARSLHVVSFSGKAKGKPSKTYAYVALGHQGFDILDITHPDHPKHLHNEPTQYTVVQVKEAKGFLFVAGWNDLRVFSLKKPKQPMLLARRRLKTRKDSFRLPYEKSLTRLRIATVAIRYPTVIVGEWLGLRSVDFVPHNVPIAAIESSDVFIQTRPGKSLHSSVFTVENQGRKTLSIQNIQFDKPGFSAVETVFHVLPGREKELTLFFKSKKKGLHYGQMTMETNDPHRPKVVVKLAAGKQRVGQSHRYFALRDCQGNRYDLSKLKGKVLLLSYFATF